MEMTVEKLYQRVRDAFPEAKGIRAAIDTVDGVNIHYYVLASANDDFSGECLLSDVMLTAANIDTAISVARARNPLNIIDPEEVLG